MSQRDHVLQLDNITMQFGGVVAVNNLSLEVNEGEIVALIGPNGAGKTTLVRVLKGLLKPDSGEIRYQGENLETKTVAELASRVGYVFQNPDYQIFKYKVLEEVMFGPLNIGMSPQEAEASAHEALRMVGLDEKAGENPYDLELSDRKMVAIASVLAMNTDVIILDEPTIAQSWNGR